MIKQLPDLHVHYSTSHLNLRLIPDRFPHSIAQICLQRRRICSSYLESWRHLCPFAFDSEFHVPSLIKKIEINFWTKHVETLDKRCHLFFVRVSHPLVKNGGNSAIWQCFSALFQSIVFFVDRLKLADTCFNYNAFQISKCSTDSSFWAKKARFQKYGLLRIWKRSFHVMKFCLPT